MKFNKYIAVCTLLGVGLLGGCKKTTKTDEIPPVVKVPVHADDLPPADNTVPSLNILWDETSVRKLSHDVYYADYGRIHRAADGSLILTYGSGVDANHSRIHVNIRRSTDNGITLSAPQIVMNGLGKPDYIGFANPEILVMKMIYMSIKSSKRRRI